ncbi:hypothetical protein A2130_03270 [Candidatus Woesebacteria bacterium GWC2_33_12]|uniref:Uncharacterized protein n=1 Tax=Candidatus Woesebacteria bacterium GW2011_GWB1_33_22 TaxID=1618566 RepID=A0A0F9ZZU6_9BACT|nr:MAG: hypothetical protein UR29_C0004G0019 [Candidatus Woesebacteria bacterium GW2011_GWC2_33_12]KKP41907.1 MAG: hypothetical protein UR33_C0008G0026 [Candidatus Woesebacteria bacterium GW2011_GWA2_33_20]KKP44481.1 MAG: hypothetical protein UR35_C0008G0026 [Candidatus Woesebacteria bacterium GW2011_GWB1_33_22]KKP46331.1 MAG: hypothetical protein UR37_C0009G0026 [Microgenomates group bacterium GW2011_GWC1_33_28]KKP50428.1 MAG: hypothetical protein UR41_C0008G0026 [Candidatus Woesebacteria bact
MKTAKQNKITFFPVFLVLVISFLILNSSFLIQAVSAQARIPLVVAPARQTVAIDPGKTADLQIKFFNESVTAVAGNIKAVDFIVTEDSGAPVLLENQVNPWVKLPYEKASIAAGDVLKVNFKVNIPTNTQPGGRYVAIMFEQTGQIPDTQTNDEGASAISSRIVGLVSIRINGPVYESAFVDIFKTPSFLEFGPIPVYFEILNKGGYHITPVGQLTLTNWFGQEVEKKTIDSKNIFPDARRNYDTKIGKTWMFGRYLLNFTASYGDQGKTITMSKFIWVVPVTLILVIILGIIIAILSTVLIIKRFKVKQVKLEEKLEEEITELESLKNKFKDKLPK